jgi:RsiW-degrading membrane proteinase PrsW (M82 family)
VIPIPGEGGKPADKRAFWRVFWGLAVVEAVAMAIWYRERWAESPVGTLLIVTMVPVLVLGHVNVFPAAMVAWLVRRRRRRTDQPDA